MQTSPPSGDARLTADSDASARLTFAVSTALLLAVAAVGVYAALELRSLYADGFYYLLRALESDAVFASAPARQTVEYIRQVPLLVATHAGVGDLRTLAVIFGLSVQLVPLAITALAWLPLPPARKFLFVFPLLHVAAGTLAAAFVPIAEGATAAAYFWLLLFSVMFTPARPRGLAVIVALAAGTALLHEAMVFLAPVLAAAAYGRWRRTPAGAARAVFLALAVGFLAVAALHAYFILDPSHPANRAAFLGAMLKMYWAIGFEGHENLPALLGLAGVAAVAAVAVLQFLPERWHVRRLGWALVAALAAVSAWEIGKAVARGEMLAAAAQFNSRNNGLMLSLPLAVAALALAIRPGALKLWALGQALAVCGVLALGGVVWQAEALRPWTRYLAIFRNVLDSHRGFVAWDDALAKLAPAERRLMRGMAHGWVEPSMSIVLAPAGHVRTILGPWQTQSWQAFDPLDPKDLPRARWWRYDDYLEALARQKAPERGR